MPRVPDPEPTGVEILHAARRGVVVQLAPPRTAIAVSRPPFGRRRQPPPRHRLLRWRRLAILSALLVGVLAVRGATDAATRWRFSVNLTESLPNWAFIIDRHDRRPQRGELVAFAPPPNRWFEQGAVFAKVVAGVPGDAVERRGRDFYVAGRNVGSAKAQARDGTPTHVGPAGVIPAGHYFVVTSHPDSLDSRYAEIGWIPGSRILGVARPVL